MKIIEPIGKGPNSGKQREFGSVAKAGESKKSKQSQKRQRVNHRSTSNSNKTAGEVELDFGSESFDSPELKSKVGSKESSYKDLLHKAIHLLSLREHSRQELFAKLNSKEPNVDLVDEVMRFLSENEYVSDPRFTEAFVRAKANKGQGPIKIRAQLKQKGVKDQVIQEYLDVQSGKWFDIAQTEYDKKYGELSVTDYNDWSKRARFLQGRGFTMDHIHCVVPQANFD